MGGGQICMTSLMNVPLPVGGSVEAVVWQEIVIEFPEKLKRYSTVGCDDVMVRLLKHRVEVVQRRMFRQQFVGQLVHAQKCFKFLYGSKFRFSVEV